eukprot:12180069-Prorocentrum_lima.AAC.1
MTSSLVGSEMCIRDRSLPSSPVSHSVPSSPRFQHFCAFFLHWLNSPLASVSYTHLTLPTICSV